MAAGDFTNIRVDSTGPDIVTMRYVYGNTNRVDLYRSTDGSSYSSVANVPAAYGAVYGYPDLVDATVAASTYYYYKLSDDSGSTFTSVYNVQTQQLFPPVDTELKALTLPTFDTEESMNPGQLDFMRHQIESFINGDYAAPSRKNCTVCPVNGALVLDCADGCFSFTVESADVSDINSISINCEKLEVSFDVPEGTTVEICGWTPGAGFDGDECFQAPVGGPIKSLPITMKPDDPCELQRTRLTSGPCKGDYIYECYSKDSLYRSNTRDVPATDCACGDFFSGLDNDVSTAYNYTVVSGRDTGLSSLEHKTYAGFSLVYKRVNSSCAGAPAAANIQELQVGGFGGSPLSVTTQGNPMFGWAMNVPENVSMESFSGHVLIFDYPNSRWIWGVYSGANLVLGTLPTIISTMPFSQLSGNITQLSMIIDSTTLNIYSDYDVIIENDSDTQTLAHSTIVLGTEPTGSGLFWMGNAQLGDHIAQLSVPHERIMFWWGA